MHTNLHLIHTHTRPDTQTHHAAPLGTGCHMHVHMSVRTKHTYGNPGGVFAHLEVLRDRGGKVITSTEAGSEGQTQDNTTL